MGGRGREDKAVDIGSRHGWAGGTVVGGPGGWRVPNIDSPQFRVSQGALKGAT